MLPDECNTDLDNNNNMGRMIDIDRSSVDAASGACLPLMIEVILWS